MYTAIDIVIALIVIAVLIDAVRSYVTSTAATTWGKLLDVGKNSATILWQRFVILVTGFTGALSWLADWLNAPGVASAIQDILKPQWVGIFILASAVITEIARRRTL